MLLLGASLSSPSVPASRLAHPEGRTAQVQGEFLPKAGSCGLRGDSRGGIAASHLGSVLSDFTERRDLPSSVLFLSRREDVAQSETGDTDDGSLADAWAWGWVGGWGMGGTEREEPAFS